MCLSLLGWHFCPVWKSLGWNVLICVTFWAYISEMKSLGFESSWMKCLNFVTSSGMIFLWMKNSQMKMTLYVSVSGITSLGWNILDENPWCVTFWDDIFGWNFWMRSLSGITFLDENVFMWSLSGISFLDENILMSSLSRMKYLGCLGWNVLILTFYEMYWMNCMNLDMRRQFLDEIGASLLLKPICFRSVGKRAWMSWDCIGTVAVAEKGERWQAHVQRIQKSSPTLTS